MLSDKTTKEEQRKQINQRLNSICDNYDDLLLLQKIFYDDIKEHLERNIESIIRGEKVQALRNMKIPYSMLASDFGVSKSTIQRYKKKLEIYHALFYNFLVLDRKDILVHEEKQKYRVINNTPRLVIGQFVDSILKDNVIFGYKEAGQVLKSPEPYITNCHAEYLECQKQRNGKSIVRREYIKYMKRNITICHDEYLKYMGRK